VCSAIIWTGGHREMSKGVGGQSFSMQSCGGQSLGDSNGGRPS